MNENEYGANGRMVTDGKTEYLQISWRENWSTRRYPDGKNEVIEDILPGKLKYSQISWRENWGTVRYPDGKTEVLEGILKGKLKYWQIS